MAIHRDGSLTVARFSHPALTKQPGPRRPASGVDPAQPMPFKASA